MNSGRALHRYRNRHDGTFEDISYMSDFALSEEDRAQPSMGIALGDYNRDGRLDLFITTFSDDYKTLYRNDGDSSFTDVSFKAGLRFLSLVGAPASLITTTTASLISSSPPVTSIPSPTKRDWAPLGRSAPSSSAISTASDSRKSRPPPAAALLPSFTRALTGTHSTPETRR